jgi:hypothetical protein
MNGTKRPREDTDYESPQKQFASTGFPVKITGLVGELVELGAP